MKKLSLLLGIIFCIVSCSTNTKKVEKGSVTDQLEDQIEKDWIAVPSDSGEVYLNIIDGKGKIQVHKKEQETVFILFESKGYNKLSAKLSSPDSLANIRFSQIFLPDGTMDGPFGRELNYDLPQDGTYKLSVHENTMAGDPWSGNFYVEVGLTKEN